MLLNKRRTPFGLDIDIYSESSLSGETFFAEGRRSGMPHALSTWTARHRCFCRSICAFRTANKQAFKQLFALKNIAIAA
jgi:hypothetical protein